MRVFRNSRVIVVAAVIVGIAALAFWPKSTEVDVVAVDRGPLVVTIDEEGETRVRDRFVVSAPVAGELQRVELEPGDPVVGRKTVVARLLPAAAPLLDPRTQAELRAAVESARALVGQAEAERERMSAALARARSNLRRVRSLSEAGAAAEDDAESAETAVRTSEEALRAAEFNVARARHDLEMANARLAPSAAGARTVDVVAPVSGVILKRLRESETVVPVGDPIVEIGNPESLQIVTDLLSTDAVRVSPGDAVIIDAWGGGAPLDGRVQRVEPSGFTKVSALGVEEQRVNVIIDLVDAAAAKRLGDGYRVEVRVVLWREASTLRVPVGTLFRRGDSWAVFTVDDDRARTQAVELGQRNDTHGQILGGLSEGQRIVLHPPDTLTDGTHVTIRAGSAP